mmetsp:Transcript_39430/g.94841  ORF Transcript_39430/g.94841 Transcript_39430/m.94841 type:complete len:125 (-) Transcript_39430:455-829(-)
MVSLWVIQQILPEEIALEREYDVIGQIIRCSPCHHTRDSVSNEGHEFFPSHLSAATGSRLEPPPSADQQPHASGERFHHLDEVSDGTSLSQSFTELEKFLHRFALRWIENEDGRCNGWVVGVDV